MLAVKVSLLHRTQSPPFGSRERFSSPRIALRGVATQFS